MQAKSSKTSEPAATTQPSFRKSLNLPVKTSGPTPVRLPLVDMSSDSLRPPSLTKTVWPSEVETCERIRQSAPGVSYVAVPKHVNCEEKNTENLSRYSTYSRRYPHGFADLRNDTDLSRWSHVESALTAAKQFCEAAKRRQQRIREEEHLDDERRLWSFLTGRPHTATLASRVRRDDTVEPS